MNELGQKQRQCSPSGIALEKAYRAALLEVPVPAALCGRPNKDQFRRFVDDTLRVLTDHSLRRPIPTPARDDLSATISHLVLCASPDCDLYERRARYRKNPLPQESEVVEVHPGTTNRGRTPEHCSRQPRMVERSAFKAPFRLGGTIYDLSEREANNPSAAIQNAETFAQEIRDVLIGSVTKNEVHSYA